MYVAPNNVPFKHKPYQSKDRTGLNILPIGFYLIVKPHLPLFPNAPKYVTNPLPPYKNMCFEATIIQENESGVLRRQTPY
jgi:hypothetical protein